MSPRQWDDEKEEGKEVEENKEEEKQQVAVVDEGFIAGMQKKPIGDDMTARREERGERTGIERRRSWWRG